MNKIFLIGFILTIALIAGCINATNKYSVITEELNPDMFCQNREQTIIKENCGPLGNRCWKFNNESKVANWILDNTSLKLYQKSKENPDIQFRDECNCIGVTLKHKYNITVRDQNKTILEEIVCPNLYCKKETIYLFLESSRTSGNNVICNYKNNTEPYDYFVKKEYFFNWTIGEWVNEQ